MSASFAAGDAAAPNAGSRSTPSSRQRNGRCPSSSATTTCCPPISSTTAARLWLIDYEYAGFGTAMFDLANLCLQHRLLRRASRPQLLEAYFGAPPAEAPAAQPRRDGSRLAAARGALVAGLRSVTSTAPASTTPPTPTTISPGSKRPSPIYHAALRSLTMTLPTARPDRRHRRRHHRLLDRLSSGQGPQGRRACCSNRASSPPARPGMPPASSASCARRPRSPRC